MYFVVKLLKLIDYKSLISERILEHLQILRNWVLHSTILMKVVGGESSWIGVISLFLHGTMTITMTASGNLLQSSLPRWAHDSFKMTSLITKNIKEWIITSVVLTHCASFQVSASQFMLGCLPTHTRVFSNPNPLHTAPCFPSLAFYRNSLGCNSTSVGCNLTRIKLSFSYCQVRIHKFLSE